MKDLQEMIEQMEASLQSHIETNHWGSGDDMISITPDVERDFVEDQCVEMGLDEQETLLILQQMGF